LPHTVTGSNTKLQGLKVLVIDDSKTIRRTAETLLAKEGCEVFTAIDGFDAQAQAHVIALRAATTADHGPIPEPPTSDQEADRRLARRQIPGRLGQLQGPENALGLLIDTERSAIGSCFVALGALRGADAIVLVSRIMGNDAQHEAILSLQRHALKLLAAAPYALVSGAH